MSFRSMSSTVIHALIIVCSSPHKWSEPSWHSAYNQTNQAGKRPKQTAGVWVMVVRSSSWPDVTSGSGALVINWCLSSFTVGTLPFPLGLLNDSILYVKPPLHWWPPLTLLPPFSLTVWARGRQRGSLIALYFHEAKFITLTSPTHAAYF